MFNLFDSVDKALSTFNEVVARLQKIKEDKEAEGTTFNEESARLLTKANESFKEANRAEKVANKIKALLEVE